MVHSLFNDVYVLLLCLIFNIPRFIVVVEFILTVLIKFEFKASKYRKHSLARSSRRNMAATEIHSVDPDFIKQNQHKTELQEEELGHINNGIKDEHPDFIDQDHYKIEIKEENEDEDFNDQNHINTGTKEVNQDPDFIDQDYYKTEIKEENRYPDEQSIDPTGSTDPQVSVQDPGT